jgi:large subunit ribosomal protein L25
MSQIVKISGKTRTSVGTASSRRLRLQGLVPCNVFGHKQDSVSISVDGDAIAGLVRSGARIIDLDVDGKEEKALVKDVQWDTFSKSIIHVDFLRVDMNERVRVQVPLQLRGTAPGVLAGGILEITHHTVEVECLAVLVPETIQVRIGALNIGDVVHVRDLQDIPEGITVVTDPDVVLLHVIRPKVAEEPAAAEGAAAEAAASPAS